ncbi:uncharacterized protein G2W53_044365 [Senna tora]|uniref:Uncharacterized protein n=1 Tax=Senna tora TaxID=362788 RepID=A0A834SK66_9FABA|nr:uncharacterized protein G2W53_044365 [Senna tora]
MSLLVSFALISDLLDARVFHFLPLLTLFFVHLCSFEPQNLSIGFLFSSTGGAPEIEYTFSSACAVSQSLGLLLLQIFRQGFSGPVSWTVHRVSPVQPVQSSFLNVEYYTEAYGFHTRSDETMDSIRLSCRGLISYKHSIDGSLIFMTG